MLVTRLDEHYSRDWNRWDWTAPVTSTLCDSLRPPVSFCQSFRRSLSGYGTVSVFLSITPSFFVCLSLYHALLSTPAPFIWPCHWAMCAVPVSKSAGRLSSFPSWRMWGQRGSCESYRLGSVKALPVGKLLPPAFLVGSHSELACLALNVLTYMQHCPLAFTCHVFNTIHILHNHNVVAKNPCALSFFISFVWVALFLSLSHSRSISFPKDSFFWV